MVDRTVISLLNKGFVVEWERADEAELAAQHAAKPAPNPDKAGVQVFGCSGIQDKAAVADTKGNTGQGRCSDASSGGQEPISPGEQARLTAATRKAFAAKVLERLEDTEPFEGKRHKLKTILQMQARHLATFLRREGDYKPFVTRW